MVQQLNGHSFSFERLCPEPCAVSACQAGPREMLYESWVFAAGGSYLGNSQKLLTTPAPLSVLQALFTTQSLVD